MRSGARTAACLLLVSMGGPGTRAAAAVPIVPQQATVMLLTAHRARAAPGAPGSVSAVAAVRPITGERTVLPVLARAADRRGRPWLQVRLPGRTLGGPAPPRNGWIIAAGTRPSTTPWQLVVDLGRRRLTVYREGRIVRDFLAITGRRATPTPVGGFFVEETVRLPAGRAGAPFALALSARSDVLQEFDGGPGQIAIHGRDNLGGRLGTAVSHGCVRLGRDAITWLALRIGPGVPVTVTAGRRRAP